MRKPHLIARALLVVAAFASGLSAVAQEASSTGIPVHVVVTVEPRHGSNVPVIHREDVMAFQGRDRAKDP
jgi:D-arabinose 5-phosphate isomerase GutQ